MRYNLPDVSIIIPTYNRSNLLMETLDSVKNQTLKNWECIVVDDGSIDSTEMEMLALVKNDSRFHYYKRPKEIVKGACGCRNFGFLKSCGRYIQWLDDDDLLSPNKLELQVSKLMDNKDDNILITCCWDLIWPGKKVELKNPVLGVKNVTKENFYSIIASQQSFIPILTYLIPRKLCLLAGEWNTALSVNDDAEYFNRILLTSKKLMNINECYVLYREHNKDRLSRKRSTKHIESFFLSLQLMHTYLKFQNLEAKVYFKWKLLKWFLAYYKTYPEIIFKYRFLLKENGIDIRWSRYYFIKFFIYKTMYPIYKKILKKKKL